MYTLLGDFVVQTAILTNLMTTFSAGMETIVQKAMNTKQEMEEIVPKEEKLREYLNEHYVGILIIYPSLMMMMMMMMMIMMIVRIRLVKNVLIKSHQSFILSFFSNSYPFIYHYTK